MPGSGRPRWLRWPRPGPEVRAGGELELARRLAAIVESSADAIVGATLDGVVTSYNPAAERMYGFSPGEIVGRHVSMFIPPETAAELAPVLERVRRGRESSISRPGSAARTGASSRCR